MKENQQGRLTRDGIRLFEAADFAGMHKAGELAARILDDVAGHVFVGQTTGEIDRFIEDQVNAAGGAAGCQIEMVLRDTQVDPKVGVDAAKALVDLEGINVLLGAISSGGVFVVGLGQGIARNAGVPYLESDYVFAQIGEGVSPARFAADHAERLRLREALRNRYHSR